MKQRITSLLIAMSLLLVTTFSHANVKQGLEWAQQGEWWEAEPYFLAEANKGDPEAMFWLAKTHMRMGGEKIFGLGYLMLQSAELGYPWAMMELVDGPETYCSFFRLPCDDEWYDKAIEKWQQMAKNGDGKAMYMLAKHKDSWRKYVPYLAHKTRVEQYIQALEMGANSAATAIYSELVRHQDKTKLEIRQQAVKYLTIAAERGYAPAMVDIHEFRDIIGEEPAKNYLLQAIDLGYVDGAFILAYDFLEKESKSQSDWQDFYKYASITKQLGKRAFTYINFDEHLSPEEIAQIDQEVAEFLTQVKPNRFYDETNLY